jgi:hypothetical protein
MAISPIKCAKSQGVADGYFLTFLFTNQSLTSSSTMWDAAVPSSAIFQVLDETLVQDDQHLLLDRRLGATTSPRDAEWGERFFHMDDPDGHELSFARPLRSSN